MTVYVMPEKKFLTTKEVECYYGIKRQTLAFWRMKDKGPPFVKAGTTVLYEAKLLMQWLKGWRARLVNRPSLRTAC